METDTPDWRQFPRMPPGSKNTIIVNQERGALLKDISLGGLSFSSSEKFNVGREISVGNRNFHLYAAVKGCEPVQAAGGAAGDLQVRCQFVPTRYRVQEQILMEYILRGGQGPTLGDSA